MKIRKWIQHVIYRGRKVSHESRSAEALDVRRWKKDCSAFVTCCTLPSERERETVCAMNNEGQGEKQNGHLCGTFEPVCGRLKSIYSLHLYRNIFKDFSMATLVKTTDTGERLKPFQLRPCVSSIWHPRLPCTFLYAILLYAWPRREKY